MTVSVTVFPNSLIHKMTLTGLDPAGVPLVVKGAPGQTAALAQFQTSAGVTVAQFHASGALQFVTVGDEINAGLIMARPGFAPNSLCIVGSGTVAGSRDVYIFDTLNVANSIASNAIVAAGTLSGSYLGLTNYIDFGSTLSDKIYLYGGAATGGYGFGIQSSRMVAFVPAAAALAVRASLGSAPVSGGSDAVALFADGHVTQTLSSAAAVGLTITGAAAQSGDLQQWRSTGAVVLTRVAANGGIGFGAATPVAEMVTFPDVTLNTTAGLTWYAPDPLAYGIYRGAGAWSGDPYTQLTLKWNTGIILNPGGNTFTNSRVDVVSGGLRVVSSSVAGAHTIVARAAGSQVADLQQWQNTGGTALARLNVTGTLGLGTIRDLTLAGPTLGFTASTVTLSSTTTGSLPTFVIKHGVGQTGDIQQWQSDAGVTLAKVRSDGLLAVPYLRDVTDTGPFFTMSSTSVTLNSTVVGATTFTIQAVAAQSGDIQQWRAPGSVLGARINKGGYLGLSTVAAPADGDLLTSEVALWWDNSAGRPNLVLKGKDSAGTVLSYSPSRLLGISKYTASGTSASRTVTATAVGMSVTFVMPALQTGQRVLIDSFAHSYSFAAAVTDPAITNNLWYSGSGLTTTQFAGSMTNGGATSSFGHGYPPLMGYLDNSQVAAGISVTVEVRSFASLATAYGFLATATSPAYVAASIV